MNKLRKLRKVIDALVLVFLLVVIGILISFGMSFFIPSLTGLWRIAFILTPAASVLWVLIYDVIKDK